MTGPVPFPSKSLARMTAGAATNAKYFLAASLLILVATFSESCHIIDDDNINALCPDSCTTIRGRFTTKDGNAGVPGMNLRFEWDTRGTLGFFSKLRKIATTKTDELGNYSIRFYVKDEELKDGGYRLHFEVPDKTYLENEFASYISFPTLKKDTIVTRNYHLPKMEATIHFRLTNPGALGPGDKLSCLLVYEYDDLDYREIYGYGALNHTDLFESTYATASEQYTYVRTLRNKNGQELLTLDSVMIGAGQTVEYEFEF